MRFSQAVSASLVARAFLAVLAFGSSALAARILKPAEFGAVVTALAAVALVMRVMSLGVGQAAQFFGAGERGGGRTYRGALIVAALTLAILATLAATLAAGPLATVLIGDDPLTRKVFASFAAGIPLTLVSFLSLLYFLGRRQFGLYYAAMGAPIAATALILGWLLLTGGRLPDVVRAYQVQFIIMALFALPMLWPLKQERSGSRLGRNLAGVARYAGKSYLIFVTAFAITRLPVLLGVRLTDLAQVGYFGVARTLAEATLQFYGAIGPVLLSYVAAGRGSPTTAPLLALVSRLSLILYASLAALTVAATWLFLVPIFGVSYAGAMLPLCILLPGVVLTGMQHTFESYLYAIDRQGTVIFAHLGGAACLVATAVVLAPTYGAMGLAAAQTLNSAVAFLVTAVLVWRVDGLSARQTLLLQGGDLARVWTAGRNLLKR